MGFAAHRKADGKALILGFKIFGFGPSRPELRHFSFVPKMSICLTFSAFGKNIGLSACRKNLDLWPVIDYLDILIAQREAFIKNKVVACIMIDGKF